MEEILKDFRHIAREIIIYIIPGFFIVFDIVILIKINNITTFDSRLFSDNTFLIFLIFLIFSFLFGHFSISFRETILQLFGFDSLLDKKLEDRLDKELYIYGVDKLRHEGFIERYNLLYAFRKNITWISIIILIINLILSAFEYRNTVIYIITMMFCLVTSLFFGFNAINTKNEYIKRIDKIYKMHQEKINEEPRNEENK